LIATITVLNDMRTTPMAGDRRMPGMILKPSTGNASFEEEGVRLKHQPEHKVEGVVVGGVSSGTVII